MDLPGVQASSRLEATVPLGDAESLERLRERTEDTVARPAGSTALVDADIPPRTQEGTSRDPGGEASTSYIATWVKDPGGHQGQYVGMELRSLASGTAPAGASRPRPAYPLRGCLCHCRAQQQGPVPGRQAGPRSRAPCNLRAARAVNCRWGAKRPSRCLVASRDKPISPREDPPLYDRSCRLVGPGKQRVRRTHTPTS